MSEKKYVRFIDSEYNTLFYVPDGWSLRTKSLYDGFASVRPCKYIDEMHFQLGNTVYHICEFAEIMEHNLVTYEPYREIGDLEFYPKKYYDRGNLDSVGQIVPYYGVLEIVKDRNTSDEVTVSYGYCLAPASADKAFCKVTSPKRWVGGVPTFEFAARIEDLCEDDKTRARMHRIVAAIMEENPQRELGDVLRDATERSNAPQGESGKRQEEREYC